ncbi:MAG TPA: 6-hydroxycyclohex-1-ene-1-carbonyl-CoA dehydrogenase [Thermoanaerobaculia bacterium]
MTYPAALSQRFSGWEFEASDQSLHRAERELRRLQPDEVLVRVAGCGVCHTDVGFLFEGVRTRRPPPLILGHEISGIVEETGANQTRLLGRAVVVPAVLPCGECALCRSGRGTICRRQLMPGNDCDGGFATHAILPGRDLCPVPGADENPDAPLGSTPGLTLRHLAVVADAVSTAYQAVARAEVASGSLAIVVGLGGVGGYAAQIAAAKGAFVVGLDVDARRLESAGQSKVGRALDPRGLVAKELKARVAEIARSAGAADTGWTIFECSGTAAGEKTAWSLLVPGATLCVVGFTLESVEVRLANLMAFDARALGNWGCAPRLYPEILEMVMAGKIDVVGNTELVPLSRAQAALEDVRAHRASRRLVLTPD